MIFHAVAEVLMIYISQFEEKILMIYYPVREAWIFRNRLIFGKFPKGGGSFPIQKNVAIFAALE